MKCIEVSGGLRSRRSEEFRTKEERRRTIPLRAILNQNMAVLKLAGGGPYRRNPLSVTVRIGKYGCATLSLATPGEVALAVHLY
ncbi:hypothetical protein Trydic_g284 [Trypoxylus dichotomus]